MNAPAKRGPIRRRKVSVELYFVLYLSAIILLLGTTPLVKKGGGDADLEEAIVQLSLRDFKVRAKRAALIYPFIPAGAAVDTAGLRLRRDSINLILASGSVADVRFAIVAIRDSASGETLPVECASLAQQGNASAEFRWRPCAPHRPGVYLVTVAGMATPLPPESVGPPELRQRVIEILRRHGPISDSVTFAVTMIELNNGIVATLRQNPIDTSAGATADTIPTDPALLAALQAIPSGGVPAIAGELQVQSPTVIAAPGSTWRNQVFFTGFTNSPDISFTVAPSNVSLVRNPTGLALSGIAPASGKQQITLRGVRASDRQTFNATFTVDASPLDGPDLPRQMYVGENYVVEFGSQGVPSEIVQVAAVAGSDTVASGGARISFTPSRTGTITFVRFVNRKRYDSYTATVIPLPAPTFNGQPDCSGGDFITVRTTSYGSIRGVPNKGQLVVDEGNVEDPIQDDYQYNSRTKAHQQTWKLRRKGKGETQITLHILDQRGSRDPNGRSRNVEFNCQ